MFLILPVSYEVETTLSPKKAARKLDREIAEHRPTLNIIGLKPVFTDAVPDSLSFSFIIIQPKNVTEVQQAFSAELNNRKTAV